MAVGGGAALGVGFGLGALRGATVGVGAVVTACVGAVVGMTGAVLWPPFVAAMKVIGDVSTGLMLFSLGVRLNTAPFAEWRIGLVGAVATPLTGMLIAWLYCLALGLSAAETDVLAGLLGLGRRLRFFPREPQQRRLVWRIFQWRRPQVACA